MLDLSNSSVLVTGGAGFLGRHVVDSLKARNCRRIIVPRSAEYDLTQGDAVRRLLQTCRPDVVIHLAARVGGIGANREQPAAFFYDNLMMGAHLIHESWRHDVQKVVAIGTVCAYPRDAAVPFTEESLWDGYPEETNAPYGLAKKMLLVQAQAYRQQYGMNTIYLLPVNLYGPGDNANPASSHVIPALIRRFVEARDANASAVEVWGTGTATREFLYVADAAEGIVLATERYDGREPVNLGSGMEISIQELAETIAGIIGYDGTILFDRTRPDGQPRRRIDSRRARDSFGFTARTSFDVGLRQTIDRYLAENRALQPARTA